MIHLESLEGRWRAAQDKFKNKRRNVRQTEDDMQVCEWHTCSHKFSNTDRYFYISTHSCINTVPSVQVMGRTLSSLKEDEIKLTFELQDKQNMLASLTAEMEELKAKHDRVSLQARVCMLT